MGRHNRHVIDSAADRSAWARDVAAQICELPDTQASALRLVYTHGLSSREAAGWLGLNIDAFHHLIAQALQRLGVTIVGEANDEDRRDPAPARR